MAPPVERERPPVVPPTDPGQGQLGKGRNNQTGGGRSNGNQGNGSGNQGGRVEPPPVRGGGSQGSGQGNPPIGRIENPPRTGGDTRVGGGRSDVNGQRTIDPGSKNRGGGVNYGGSNNNQYEAAKGRAPGGWGKAPNGNLEYQVRREDRVREVRNHWRTGYWGYNNYWRDDDFRFGYYVFDPYSNYRCYASPWYYYPHLPGYVNYSCVRVLTLNLGPFQWVDYRWNRPVYAYDTFGYSNSYSYTALDYSVDDIQRAFERRDERALSRIVPRTGDVNIWTDGRYQYTMNADTFYDLMEDNVYGTRTSNYQILSTRTYRDYAEVTARHEFTDPWGRRVSVYHWYRLEKERGAYVVRDFGTSDQRW